MPMLRKHNCVWLSRARQVCFQFSVCAQEWRWRISLRRAACEMSGAHAYLVCAGRSVLYRQSNQYSANLDIWYICKFRTSFADVRMSAPGASRDRIALARASSVFLKYIRLACGSHGQVARCFRRQPVRLQLIFRRHRPASGPQFLARLTAPNALPRPRVPEYRVLYSAASNFSAL